MSKARSQHEKLEEGNEAAFSHLSAQSQPILCSFSTQTDPELESPMSMWDTCDDLTENQPSLSLAADIFMLSISKHAPGVAPAVRALLDSLLIFLSNLPGSLLADVNTDDESDIYDAIQPTYVPHDLLTLLKVFFVIEDVLVSSRQEGKLEITAVDISESYPDICEEESILVSPLGISHLPPAEDSPVAFANDTASSTMNLVDTATKDSFRGSSLKSTFTQTELSPESVIDSLSANICPHQTPCLMKNASTQSELAESSEMVFETEPLNVGKIVHALKKVVDSATSCENILLSNMSTQTDQPAFERTNYSLAVDNSNNIREVDETLKLQHASEKRVCVVSPMQDSIDSLRYSSEYNSVDTSTQTESLIQTGSKMDSKSPDELEVEQKIASLLSSLHVIAESLVPESLTQAQNSEANFLLSQIESNLPNLESLLSPSTISENSMNDFIDAVNPCHVPVNFVLDCFEGDCATRDTEIWGPPALMDLDNKTKEEKPIHDENDPLDEICSPPLSMDEVSLDPVASSPPSSVSSTLTKANEGTPDADLKPLFAQPDAHDTPTDFWTAFPSLPHESHSIFSLPIYSLASWWRMQLSLGWAFPPGSLYSSPMAALLTPLGNLYIHAVVGITNLVVYRGRSLLQLISC